MQLPSKTRFIAGQFVELLGSDLWKEISRHSCERARELRAGLEDLRKIPEGAKAIQFQQKTEANAIFVCFDRELEKVLKKSAFFYVWNEETRECRLMTSWSTTSDDVKRFIETARAHLTKAPVGGAK